MRLMVLDSSGAVAAVALAVDGRILGEYSIDHKITHSQTLLPMLEELTRRTEYDISTTDAIAVAAGPGSFTGLRIGAAAAKGMAEALGCRILPVPTLEGLCYQLTEWRGLICPMLDARRSQVYSAIYRFEKDGLQTICKAEALDIKEQLERLDGMQEEVIFLGDGCDAYESVLALGEHPLRRIAPMHKRYQSAACVAMRAMELGEAACIAAEAFAPEYLRRSQAEREREERLSTGV